MNGENEYSDMIRMPHPVSVRHPRMDRLNRAAQFASFQALTGYQQAIAEAERKVQQSMEQG